MNWTWHNNFIQERLLNVEESPILFSVPSVILQQMIFLIKVISVIMCLFLSEILDFGLLTPVEKDRQKLQLLKKKKKKKRQTIFIQSVTYKVHLILVLNASEYVY